MTIRETYFERARSRAKELYRGGYSKDQWWEVIETEFPKLTADQLYHIEDYIDGLKEN